MLGGMKRKVCIGMREERVENEEKELGRKERNRESYKRVKDR